MNKTIIIRARGDGKSLIKHELTNHSVWKEIFDVVEKKYGYMVNYRPKKKEKENEK